MPEETVTLDELGWRHELAVQLGPEEHSGLRPARVLGVHRSTLSLAGPGVASVAPLPRTDDDAITVGDWVLVDAAANRIARRLDRLGLFKRRAAGTNRRVQLIAANVDTLLVATSADRDFNIARLERYLALAREGGATPVIVVTKADTNDAATELAAQAARLAPGLVAEAMDARQRAAAGILAPWCGLGQTVALVGSSGVGKSTLINTLTGAGQITQPVRAADQRGRHSTTSRTMHRVAAGGWLIDTPGMRELALVDSAAALDDVFHEIAALAEMCRFADCLHQTEPGCAVREAIDSGVLESARLQRYLKLVAEERHNSETLAERRARFRSLGKLYRSVQRTKSSRRGMD